MSKRTRNNWIQQAIRKKGAFRKQAQRAGKSTMEFAREVVRNPERYSTTTVRRARLALTLSKFSKRGKRR